MKTLTPTRFQYNLSLLNGGSTTVRVEQKVNGVYQYLATQQTQTSSGTYELSFVPSETDIRISVSGTSRYALNNLYLDRDQIDTLVATYALSRGYRYGFNGMEKDDEVSGKGNSYTAEFWQYDSRLGRRWNRDPVVKYNSSLYSVLSNNPIIMVDPKGNTDYYNKAGHWVGSDGINNGEIRLIKAESIIDNNMFLEVYGEDIMVRKVIFETANKFDTNNDLTRNSIPITFKDGLESDLKALFDKSVKAKKEISAYVTLNIETGEVSLFEQPIYKENTMTRSANKMKSDNIDGNSINVVSGFSNLVILSQVHTHPGSEYQLDVFSGNKIGVSHGDACADVSHKLSDDLKRPVISINAFKVGGKSNTNFLKPNDSNQYKIDNKDVYKKSLEFTKPE